MHARAPMWTEQFRTELQELLVWRRDERHFRCEPLTDGLLDSLLETACLAPSVGNAQPWRFVEVQCTMRRARIIEIFEHENTEALGCYSGDQATSYAALKLAGLREAPVHLAVFCDEATSSGHGLGRRTMPEMLRYSVVCAVHTFWLAARAQGLGVGWVSILDPVEVGNCLDVPPNWSLVGYLCIGWPQQAHDVPELERRRWQERLAAETFFFTR
jgi:5,6-dimethylbenzimidazole synthase